MPKLICIAYNRYIVFILHRYAARIVSIERRDKNLIYYVRLTGWMDSVKRPLSASWSLSILKWNYCVACISNGLWMATHLGKMPFESNCRKDIATETVPTAIIMPLSIVPVSGQVCFFSIYFRLGINLFINHCSATIGLCLVCCVFICQIPGFVSSCRAHNLMGTA